MNKIKSFMLRYKNLIFDVSLAITAALGVYVAYATVFRYAIIVRAILGFTIFYLLYRLYLSPERADHRPISLRLEFPKALWYLPYEFLLCIVMFWAGQQVLDLIWYLMSIFSKR